MRQAISKHLRDFIAILALVVIAAGVGGYILVNQRFHAPGWVPVIGKDFFELKAEFSTAQAVTPGQGQTVNIAGVKVGEITKVELVQGRAMVSMNIEPKYAAIYRDASALLRPKTGLKDMVIELSPGTPTSGKLDEGEPIRIQNTLPDINPDEVLAALDADTRDYLRLLLGGAGEGLRGNAQNLSAAFRRFEPTARDVRKITLKLAERRRNLSRVIHNFQLLSTELSTKDDQIAGFVDSSNAVFASFARQDARLRETVRLLPGALQETQRGLAKTDRLARQLGPTLQALRPTARNLGPALVAVRPFLRDSTPIIRDQLRPFSRDVLPVVRDLRPAITDLSALTPNLVSITRVANYLLNELAYNPPGPTEEGYLFWLSWANHAATAVFPTADAHGPIRRGLFIASCSSLGVLNQIASANPQLSTLIQLLNAPISDPTICPQASGPGNTPSGPSPSPFPVPVPVPVP